MRKVIRIVVATAAVASFLFITPDAGAATKRMGFRYCSWQVTTHQVQDQTSRALTETYDLNGGCRPLRAEVSYYTAPGTVTIKNCGWKHSSYHQCVQLYKEHHQGRGWAIDIESGHSQNSGWFG